MALKAGEKLGPYEIVSAIGKGGMGEVWKARDPLLGRDVSLRKTARHARAAEVRVTLSGRKDGIILRVEDIGDGFDLKEAKGKGGLGLISMEERVRLLNGKFTIHSQPGKGTTVEVFVPLVRKRK
jgi:signal transduction histidine kinase